MRNGSSGNRKLRPGKGRVGEITATAGIFQNKSPASFSRAFCRDADHRSSLSSFMPKQRCPWPTDELYCEYHDREWGVPNHDDRHLFEMLILEGAQAGL